MKSRAVFVSGLLVVAAVGLAVALMVTRSGRRATGPLAHEVYVWQRAWTQPIREAVAQRGSNFAAIVPLRAEVSWMDGQPQLTRVAVDYPSLARTRRPIGLALRIGPHPGPFAADDATARFLCETAAALVAEARTNGVSPAELQLDFDCATARLDGYRVWVETVQRRVAPLPVTITALPSWLRSPAFARLARVAPNYVLQVHSVERPASFEAPFTLCAPLAAQRAVERAGRIGVPFRVALPTYGYILAFDSAGGFRGLAAEGPRPNWPADTRLREISTDPQAMAMLVQSWTANRPAAMRGVIWYRLPVATDALNWRWPTLQAMLAGRVPRENIRAEVRRVEPGLLEITLVNDGDLDISSRVVVEARWSGARLLASDGQAGFQLVDSAPSAAQFQMQSARLRAGDRLVAGWLRLDRDCEVTCEARKF